MQAALLIVDSNQSATLTDSAWAGRGLPAGGIRSLFKFATTRSQSVLANTSDVIDLLPERLIPAAGLEPEWQPIQYLFISGETLVANPESPAELMVLAAVCFGGAAAATRMAIAGSASIMGSIADSINALCLRF